MANHFDLRKKIKQNNDVDLRDKINNGPSRCEKIQEKFEIRGKNTRAIALSGELSKEPFKKSVKVKEDNKRRGFGYFVEKEESGWIKSPRSFHPRKLHEHWLPLEVESPPIKQTASFSVVKKKSKYLHSVLKAFPEVQKKESLHTKTHSNPSYNDRKHTDADKRIKKSEKISPSMSSTEKKYLNQLYTSLSIFKKNSGLNGKIKFRPSRRKNVLDPLEKQQRFFKKALAFICSKP